MTIQVSTTDARTAKALAILEGADRWLKIRRKSDGTRFYVIPGCNGHVYWTNLHECSCPDHLHRGETVTCKHRLAVALRVAQLKATRQARPAPAPKPAPDCRGCAQHRNWKRYGGRRLSQAERLPCTCGTAAQVPEPAPKLRYEDIYGVDETADKPRTPCIGRLAS